MAAQSLFKGCHFLPEIILLNVRGYCLSGSPVPFPTQFPTEGNSPPELSATAGNPPSGLDSSLSLELPGLGRDDGRTRSGGGSFHHQSVGTEVCTRTRPTASTAFELDVDGEELGELWSVLELEEKTRVRDRTIISVLLHGLRASEASALNVGSWNGKILTVH